MEIYNPRHVVYKPYILLSFITAYIPQREEVCNASFECCGKYVTVISRSDSKIRFDLNLRFIIVHYYFLSKINY